MLTRAARLRADEICPLLQVDSLQVIASALPLDAVFVLSGVSKFLRSSFWGRQGAVCKFDANDCCLTGARSLSQWKTVAAKFGQPDYHSITRAVAVHNDDPLDAPCQLSFGPRGDLWVALLCPQSKGALYRTHGRDGALEQDMGFMRGPVGVAVTAVTAIGGYKVLYCDGEYDDYDDDEDDWGSPWSLNVMFVGGGGDGFEINMPHGLLQAPAGLSLSPDDTKVAVADLNGSIHILSLDNSTEPETFSLDNNPIDVAWTPDGQQLVVADRDDDLGTSGCIQVLNATDGSFVRKIELGPVANANGVCVDRSGNIVVLTDDHVRVYSSAGELIHDQVGGLEFDCRTGCAGICIEPTTGRLALSKEDGCAYLL